MPETSVLAQGDLRLLESDLATQLLQSRLPARVAYVATDGLPRIVPSWFHWTGQELVMPTFLAAPHVHRPSRRLRDLAANPAVAVSVDTETSPPQALTMRGEVVICEVDGIAPEYALAAHRYLGSEAAEAYLTGIDRPGTRMARIALRPTWVGLLDFANRLPTVMTS